VFTATAPVTGGRRALAIPDVFDAPFALVVRALAEWHSGLAAGVAPVRQGPAAAAPEVGVSEFRWPWVTIALLAAFIVAFAIEQQFAVAPGGRALSPAVATLAALGGLNRALVEAGEWYRLLSAPFLHLNVSHLVFNGISFALAGYALERYVGRAWMFCIFAAGALAGSVASLVLMAPNTVSVGASGGIMAMLVSLFLISFRLPIGRMRTQIQAQSAWFAVPSLIPAGAAVGAMHVDYGAHFGGAVLGVTVGFVLLRTWREEAPLPRFRANAALFAIVAALAFAASAVAVAWRYPAQATPAGMIPAAELPHSPAEATAKADRLLATWPSDPRSHLIAGAARAQRRDVVGAEHEFRIALSLAGTSQPPLLPNFVNATRATLALTLVVEQRGVEARVMAHEPCLATGDAAPPATVMALLAKNSLCGEAATPPR
jgi:rhomboid protease GluP